MDWPYAYTPYIPPESDPLWARLGQALETRQRTGRSVWNALEDRLEEREPPGEVVAAAVREKD
jgi:hypothetical protein